MRLLWYLGHIDTAYLIEVWRNLWKSSVYLVYTLLSKETLSRSFLSYISKSILAIPINCYYFSNQFCLPTADVSKKWLKLYTFQRMCFRPRTIEIWLITTVSITAGGICPVNHSGFQYDLKFNRILNLTNLYVCIGSSSDNVN